MLIGAIVEDEKLVNLTQGIPVRTSLLDFEHNFHAGLLNDKSPVIIVPYNWNEMDEETLRFVITHEVGHHELGHVAEKSSSEVVDHRKDLMCEFEADEYAAKRIGRMATINGLRKTFQWFVKNWLFVDMLGIGNQISVRILAVLSPSTRWKQAMVWWGFLGVKKQ